MTKPGNAQPVAKALYHVTNSRSVIYEEIRSGRLRSVKRPVPAHLGRRHQ